MKMTQLMKLKTKKEEFKRDITLFIITGVLNLK